MARSRPPWPSKIERQIESPIPMPLGLVVKKGSNNRPAFSAEIPAPQTGAVDGVPAFLNRAGVIRKNEAGKQPPVPELAPQDAQNRFVARD